MTCFVLAKEEEIGRERKNSDREKGRGKVFS